MSTVIVASESAALTPARAELARVNSQIAATEMERDQAQALLDGSGAELRTVEEQLAPLQAQWDSDLAAWNSAGCPGTAPEAPRDYVTLQRARVVLREKLGANDGHSAGCGRYCGALSGASGGLESAAAIGASSRGRLGCTRTPLWARCRKNDRVDK